MTIQPLEAASEEEDSGNNKNTYRSFHSYGFLHIELL